ncbi:retrovirus-related Pol polyprotein from transposon 17.6 [Trichonephila clavipes]|nr:retrovirus-related Pol polyprotein from transposon 17.6 [Trichonephila clavipes]
MWVRHLLDDHMTSLPVAEVDIESDLSIVTSKAAMIGNHLDQGWYILGNQIAALLQGIEENCPSNVEKVNAVVTRSQTRQKNSENEEILLPVDYCSPINPMTQIKPSAFIAEQQKVKNLPQ